MPNSVENRQRVSALIARDVAGGSARVRTGAREAL